MMKKLESQRQLDQSGKATMEQSKTFRPKLDYVVGLRALASEDTALDVLPVLTGVPDT